jgi:hypothetical protein
MAKRMIYGDRSAPNTLAIETTEGASPSLTEPHALLVIPLPAILEGKFSAAAQAIGWQTIVYDGDRAREAPIGASAGDSVEYAGSWLPEAIEAVEKALSLAENEEDFAVVTVPEIGLTTIWLRESQRFIPVDFGRRVAGLDPQRAYTEGELLEHVRPAVVDRLAATRLQPPIG